MLQKLEGIVTDIVHHNDSQNVVTLYTRTHGRMAFMVPVGKSKSGRMRNAMLSLMAVVSADVNVSPARELQHLRQVTPIRLWHNIYANPLKCSILFFIAEFSNRLLRQYPADPLLWQWLVDSLEQLDTLPSGHISNYHLAFLVGLLGFTGIRPEGVSAEEGDFFDMLSGEMITADNPDFLKRRSLLPSAESRLVPLVLRMNFRNMHLFSLSRAERNRLLDHILQYYSIHLPLPSEYKSLAVLRELSR